MSSTTNAMNRYMDKLEGIEKPKPEPEISNLDEFLISLHKELDEALMLDKLQIDIEAEIYRQNKIKKAPEANSLFHKIKAERQQQQEKEEFEMKLAAGR